MQIYQEHEQQIEEERRTAYQPPGQRLALLQQGRSLFQTASNWLPRWNKFLLVGGLGVLVNTASLFLLHQVLAVPLVIASVLAVETAIAHNFVWHDRWTFRRTSLSFRRFVKFNVVSLAGLAIATSTLWLLVTYLRIPYLLANLLGIGASTGWNFVMSLFWAWG